MKNIQQFPAALLDDSIEARITYFEKLTIAHPALQNAFKQAMGAITGHAAPKVILVAGPTGAGKTTLATHMYRKVREQYATQMESELDLVPVLYGNAIAPNGSSFSWKDFYVRLLGRAMEPLIDRKVLAPRQLSFFPSDRTSSLHEKTTSDALRRSVEECMRRRRTKVLIIDEAHHVLMVNNPKKLEFQFESLKSLAIETKATIVLIGTYRLLDIRDQSGQLVRRSEIVHFPRYDERTKQDQASFNAVLQTFQNHLPLATHPALGTHAEKFYLYSGGCVGILKEWLARAYARHLETNNKIFDWDFIKPFALTKKALKTIIEEALVGEQKLSDISEDELEKLLKEGLPTIPRANPRTSTRPPVGRRAATRDPVGGAYATA
ncbi:AAA family ATPase [Rugamonas aquatica]|uniref:AAA family ATPase n=1 Tax=Rugamonas aquatica TaxID=2743357 RepID=A0A6A7N0F3_9BURK|nr:TniB family NTP-binding protein [Rugamonas aquatica]MQA38509.1 AAA family ATPase [Rugamonas aquatica]